MENKTKYVACPRRGCEGIVARIQNDKLISIKRSKTRVTSYMQDGYITVTCPNKCEQMTTILFKAGKVDMSNLTLKSYEEYNKDKLNKDNNG